MDEAEHDVLACVTFPKAYWLQTYSNNSLERLNAEIKRRTNVVGMGDLDPMLRRASRVHNLPVSWLDICWWISGRRRPLRHCRLHPPLRPR
jgi:hypothetical protein